MRLVLNSPPKGHVRELKALLADADEIIILAAFLKYRGLKQIRTQLISCLERGGRVTVCAGSNFCLTEAEALRDLLEIAGEMQSLTVWLSAGQHTFHPKVYAAVTGGQATLLVGSANLTDGALGSNEEASVLIGPAHSTGMLIEVRSWLDRMKASRRLQPLDHIRLREYERKVERERRARQIARAELARLSDADEPAFDEKRIQRFYKQYRRGVRPEDVDARSRARHHALAIQNRLADLAGRKLTAAERTEIRDGLRNLIGSAGYDHFWFSDGIFRHSSGMLEEPAKLAKLFRAGRQASRLHPAKAFEKMKAPAIAVPGAGVNMMTEILTTFNPERFPVFNGSTKDALRKLGFPEFSTMTKKSFPAVRYSEAASIIGAVRTRIGAPDFPATDAFLRFVAQNMPEG